MSLKLFRSFKRLCHRELGMPNKCRPTGVFTVLSYVWSLGLLVLRAPISVCLPNTFSPFSADFSLTRTYSCWQMAQMEAVFGVTCQFGLRGQGLSSRDPRGGQAPLALKISFHAIFRHFGGKTPILSKFWAQAPPLGSKLSWAP